MLLKKGGIVEERSVQHLSGSKQGLQHAKHVHVTKIYLCPAIVVPSESIF